MKKTIIILTASVLFMHAASAQKTRVGFTGGATLSNFRSNEDNGDESGKSKIGFTGGVIANISSGKNFSVQTGINWVQKGSQEKETSGGVTEKISLIVNSIEVPVNFLYNRGGFFIGAGPSVSLAVSGKLNYKYNDDEISVKLKLGNSDDDNMKRIDLGANFLAGYQLPGGLMITANFNQGLSNLMAGGSDNSKVKSHYFGIRLGYLLKGKK